MSGQTPITLQTAAQARGHILRAAMGGESYGEAYVTEAVDRLLLAGYIDTDAVLGSIGAGLPAAPEQTDAEKEQDA